MSIDFSIEIWSNPDTWMALLTLTIMEIVLGIDNVIFISIITNELPEKKQPRVRFIGIMFALLLRIVMLAGLSYLIHISKPLFTVFEIDLSIRDILLAAGGLFLLWKATSEIHHKLTDATDKRKKPKLKSISLIIFQIIVLDAVFSIDSVLTAIGMAEELLVMIIAVIISMILMVVFANSISKFIQKNPTLQVLAMSFLLLIGVMLLVEGFHYEIPKGYIYFAVFFSLIVEILNIRVSRRKRKKKYTEIE